MKLDDIVLLGFVDEALKHLKNEVKENERPEIDRLISQLDIEQMKNDLNAKFGSSFIGADQVIKALMKSGNESFNEYTTKKQHEEKVMNEISTLFDDSFLDNEDVKEITANLGNLELDETKNNSTQKELAKLISELKTRLLEERSNTKENEDESELPFISNDDKIYNAIRKATNQKEYSNDIKQTNAFGPDYDASVLDRIISDIKKEERDEKSIYGNSNSGNQNGDYVSNLVNELQDKIAFKDSAKKMTNSQSKETGSDTYSEEVHDLYVANLMKDLQRRIEVEEEQKKEAEEKEEIYKQINEVYTYLPRRFVHVVYDARNKIIEGLLSSQSVILIQRLRFIELDNLRQFAEILLTHDYNVNVDEGQMIVDVIKKINNTEGNIIKNIFEVANQASALEGTYDGYRIIKDDDVNITDK